MFRALISFVCVVLVIAVIGLLVIAVIQDERIDRLEGEPWRESEYKDVLYGHGLSSDQR